MSKTFCTFVVKSYAIGKSLQRYDKNI